MCLQLHIDILKSMEELILSHDRKKSSVGGGLRSPKCTRCRNHGMLNDLRGHKHKCYWRDCTCAKCLISSDRQRATADRIALFRQQVRQVVPNDRKRRRSEGTKSNLSDEEYDDHSGKDQRKIYEKFEQSLSTPGKINFLDLRSFQFLAF